MLIKKMKYVVYFIILFQLTLLGQSSLEFDKIVFSSEGCYGNCPIFDLEINRDGTFFYRGRKDSKIFGDYKGSFDKNIFGTICNLNFVKDIDTIKTEIVYNEYEIDGYLTSISFIKNDSIICTIINLSTFDANQSESPEYDELAKYLISLITESNIRQKRGFNFQYLADVFISEITRDNEKITLTNSQNYFLINYLDKYSTISEGDNYLPYSTSFSDYAMYSGYDDYYSNIYLSGINIFEKDEVVDKFDPSEIERIKKKYENLPSVIKTNGEIFYFKFISGKEQSLRVKKNIIKYLK
ncbi:MAG: hypothetical protein IH618_16965 [Ignavibacteriaceae bacterium]|nr:hypothetical protein [Ignavibacteriaceae bacterium]